ncbi:MAG: hypothetical protein IMF15_10250, partial [Proteobacteria bacterium]|nr:hypothetical protein [Pseudomonadota bacterium]
SIIPEKFTEDDVEMICAEAKSLCCSNNVDINKVVSSLDGVSANVQQHLSAMIVMACLSVKLVNPIFARSDAIGTVMRKKIKPVTDPVLEQIHILRS